MTFDELDKELRLLKSPSGERIKKWCETNLPKVGDVHASNEYGMTPLHRAAVSGDALILVFLLSHGANASTHNLQEQTALFSALMLPMAYKAGLKEEKMACFRELREKVPHVMKQQDTNGDTVLQLMVINAFIPLIKELLDVEPEVARIPNKRQIYPIHTAILNQQAECVSLLLQQEGAERLIDSTGRGPLHYAACYGTKEIVMKCCDVVKDLNSCDARGVTPLMLAAKSGNIETLDALIKQGADTELIDPYGRNILEYAQEGKHKKVVLWIQEHVRGLAQVPK